MAHFYTESFSLREMFSSYSYSRVGKIPSVFIKIKKYGIKPSFNIPTLMHDCPYLSVTLVILNITTSSNYYYSTNS